MRRLDDFPILGHGVFFLLYVLLMFPRRFSHGMKVETTTSTSMLFNFSMRVLASYIDVWVELLLLILIVFDF